MHDSLMWCHKDDQLENLLFLVCIVVFLHKHFRLFHNHRESTKCVLRYFELQTWTLSLPGIFPLEQVKTYSLEAHVGGFSRGDFRDMPECADSRGINGERILLWYLSNSKSRSVLGSTSNGIWAGIASLQYSQTFCALRL